MDSPTAELDTATLTALFRLGLACSMAPGTDWFLYGFVRHEYTQILTGDDA